VIGRCAVALCGALSFCALSFCARASAEERPHEEDPSLSSRVQRATEQGSFLPLTLPPSVSRASAVAAGYGGYDSAGSAARLESFAEAHIYGRFALRYGMQSRSLSHSVAPSVAGRVQLLSQASHGFDGAVSLAYKAEGFDEPEGEVELVLAAAHSVGRWRLIGNIGYGQDPEGFERDGELRGAFLYRFGSVQYGGLDARGRFDLGSERTHLVARNEPTFDLDVGPVLNLALGPVALGVHGGLSVLRRVDGQAQAGFLAMGGLGTAL